MIQYFKNFPFLYSFLVYCLFTLPCEAASVGGAAKNLTMPTHYIAKLLLGICLATGIGLLISSMVQYAEYRKNAQIRLSLIFFLLLTGLSLIGISFLPLPESLS